MEELLQALRVLRNHPDMGFSGPPHPSLIELAEHRLGLTFPPTYRRFIEELGTGHVGPTEIYGIVPSGIDGQAVPNAVWATEFARSRFGMQHNVIVVGDTGIGEFYGLLTARENVRAESLEAPVVTIAMAQGHDGTALAAKEFGVFLLDLVREWTGR